METYIESGEEIKWKGSSPNNLFLGYDFYLLQVISFILLSLAFYTENIIIYGTLILFQVSFLFILNKDKEYRTKIIYLVTDSKVYIIDKKTKCKIYCKDINSLPEALPLYKKSTGTFLFFGDTSLKETTYTRTFWFHSKININSHYSLHKYKKVSKFFHFKNFNQIREEFYKSTNLERRIYEPRKRNPISYSFQATLLIAEYLCIVIIILICLLLLATI